jgi:hypothetical protein
MFRYVALIALLLWPSPLYASFTTREQDGINAENLKMPDGTTTLTGAGIPIGQVEGGRPPKNGLDSPTNVNPFSNPTEVWRQTTQITAPGLELDNHAALMSDIMLNTNNGISPQASLYSGAYVTEGIVGYSDALLTVQQIARRPNSDGTRAINNSWGKLLDDIDTTDGYSQLTLGMDWISSTHEVLLVFAGNEEDREGRVPSDNYNGITVAASARDVGVYRRVANINRFDDDAIGIDRVSVDLIAPGEDFPANGIGGAGFNIIAWTSAAAPHVTGTVALLQQYGDFQSTNVGGPHWDPTNPKRHEVMKAVLLNSADKLNNVHGSKRTVVSDDDSNNYTWLDSPAFSDDAQSLDIQMGAGHLNAGRALTQFKTGEWDVFSEVPTIGWDYHETGGIGTVPLTYPLETTVEGYVAITLAWDRQITKFGGSANLYGPSDMFDGGLNDLDLYLMPQGWQELGYVLGDQHTIAKSVAEDESVEHIFKSVPSGLYEIVVHHFGGIGTDQDYALAWWMGEANCPGDFNGSGATNGRDFLEWQRNPSVGSLADWQSGYGSSCLTAASTAVPEPSSVAMLSLLAAAPLMRRSA